jgi:hypothetical protein
MSGGATCPRPLLVSRLDVDETHRLRVFIWKDRADLQTATGQHDAGAYWHSPELHVFIDEEGILVDVYNRLVSTLHFYQGGFGAGVVAHELQHFIQSWVEIGAVGEGEAVCELAGRLTRDFWDWFYRHFEYVAPSNR